MTEVIKNNIYISKEKSKIFNKLNIILKDLRSKWIKEFSDLNKDNNKISFNFKNDFNYFYESNKNSLTKHKNKDLLKYENWNSKIETPFWLSIYVFFFLLAFFFVFYSLNIYCNTSIKQLIDYLYVVDVTRNEVINKLSTFNTKYHNILEFNKNEDYYTNMHKKHKYLYKKKILKINYIHEMKFYFNNKNLIDRFFNYNNEIRDQNFAIENSLINEKNIFDKKMNINKENRKEVLKSLNSNNQNSDFFKITYLGTYLDTDSRDYQVHSMNRFNFFINKFNNKRSLYKLDRLILYVEDLITFHIREMLFETYSSKYNRNTNMSDGTYYISKSREFHLIHNLLILEDDKKDNRNPL
jgi:hypothetical protein